MFAKLIDEFAEKVITNGFADEDDPLIGCTENEIAEIESKCGCKLPDVYRAFLLKMGRSSGEFMSVCS